MVNVSLCPYMAFCLFVHGGRDPHHMVHNVFIGQEVETKAELWSHRLEETITGHGQQQDEMVRGSDK